MAITRPKTKIPDSSAAADSFITGAPDAVRVKGVKKGNKQQISLTIAPTLLAKVDELAAELGQSRAAIINMAIYRAVEHGLIIDGIKR
ncbi:MAG: ribbon-helix-helix protein, CopG family [Sulfuriferula sp.]